MKKLIRGIVDFRKKVLPSYREMFKKLAIEQRPDTLFIACSDSRVVPNLFASSDPGDLFVIRNVGNLISPCGKDGVVSDISEAAAIEFSLSQLPVKDIIVCGHSECGAMQAVLHGRDKVQSLPLRSWLRHGDPALKSLKEGKTLNAKLSDSNQLSQLNVLQQLENLKTYKIVSDRLAEGTLRLHAWWFDIARADVYAFDPDEGCFVHIDEEHAKKLYEVEDLWETAAACGSKCRDHRPRVRRQDSDSISVGLT